MCEGCASAHPGIVLLEGGLEALSCAATEESEKQPQLPRARNPPTLPSPPTSLTKATSLSPSASGKEEGRAIPRGAAGIASWVAADSLHSNSPPLSRAIPVPTAAPSIAASVFGAGLTLAGEWLRLASASEKGQDPQASRREEAPLVQGRIQRKENSPPLSEAAEDAQRGAVGGAALKRLPSPPSEAQSRLVRCLLKQLGGADEPTPAAAASPFSNSSERASSQTASEKTSALCRSPKAAAFKGSAGFSLRVPSLRASYGSAIDGPAKVFRRRGGNAQRNEKNTAEAPL